MPLPAGVITRRITFGPPRNFIGDLVNATVTFSPSTALVHLASGTPLFAESLPRQTDELTGIGSIVLPCTDQSGFGDGQGNAITNWLYRVAWTLSVGNVPVPAPFWVALPTGDLSDVDLDLMVPVSGSGGVTVSIPAAPPGLFVITPPVTS